jgi:hypothetical protein
MQDTRSQRGFDPGATALGNIWSLGCASIFSDDGPVITFEFSTAIRGVVVYFIGRVNHRANMPVR